ncbi:hypothetical protein HY745_12825, partial [Candidatus Desantisbacteria bacterium]|nr:hypothetical protein [Candidatus Desantisbacteria bacterium]
MKTFLIEEEYIRLSFVADNILGKGSIVDAYYGDINLLKDLPQFDVPTLIRELEQLRKSISGKFHDEADIFRKTMLEKQVDALIMYIRIKKNLIDIGYKEAVKVLLDIDIVEEPQLQLMEQLRYKLQELLKKSGYQGTLFEMFNLWSTKNEIDADEFLKEVKDIALVFLTKTRDKVLSKILLPSEAEELIKSSNVEFAVVDTNQGWSGYNYYDRNFFGKVVFNRKIKRNKNSAFGIVAHEAYPGHHTSCIIREYLYNKKKLGAEAS